MPERKLQVGDWVNWSHGNHVESWPRQVIWVNDKNPQEFQTNKDINLQGFKTICWVFNSDFVVVEVSHETRDQR